MATAEQFTDVDVRQLALVIHEARCGWNCQGHGIMQQRQDERDEATARAVLVDLVKRGRLATEHRLTQAATCRCALGTAAGGEGNRRHTAWRPVGAACCRRSP